MSEKNNLTTELSRELSLFQITAMGLGMMIGAGVFLGIGNSIRESGPGGVILTFSFNYASCFIYRDVLCRAVICNS